jgi:hypothetical protein
MSNTNKNKGQILTSTFQGSLDAIPEKFKRFVKVVKTEQQVSLGEALPTLSGTLAASALTQERTDERKLTQVTLEISTTLAPNVGMVETEHGEAFVMEKLCLLSWFTQETYETGATDLSYPNLTSGTYTAAGTLDIYAYMGVSGNDKFRVLEADMTPTGDGVTGILRVTKLIAAAYPELIENTIYEEYGLSVPIVVKKQLVAKTNTPATQATAAGVITRTEYKDYDDRRSLKITSVVTASAFTSQVHKWYDVANIVVPDILTDVILGWAVGDNYDWEWHIKYKNGYRGPAKTLNIRTFTFSDATTPTYAVTQFQEQQLTIYTESIFDGRAVCKSTPLQPHICAGVDYEIYVNGEEVALPDGASVRPQSTGIGVKDIVATPTFKVYSVSGDTPSIGSAVSVWTAGDWIVIPGDVKDGPFGLKVRTEVLAQIPVTPA